MHLLPELIVLALVGVLSAGLAFGLICFVAGVHSSDRAELSSPPGGPCARFARRAAGLHVITPRNED